MKAVGSSLLLDITNGEPRLAPERLDSLLDDRLGLIGILQRFLIESDGVRR